MKKLFAALMAFVALGASAQTKTVGEVTWTPQLSLGYVHGTNMDDYDGWIASSIGISGKYQVSESFGLKFGAAYWYGESREVKYESDGVTAKMEASYLEIPLLASFDLSKKWGIQLGLKPAIETSFKLHAEGGKTTMEQDADNTSKFQLYVPVGLTYQFNSPLSLGFHYSLPLTKINKGEGSNKLNQFMFTLG
ncbi:MAG: PorT family protein, partial [Bacteroidaceae bacterium]|nr:PorT family protein [Bacteroidaceae bacterium]